MSGMNMNLRLAEHADTLPQPTDASLVIVQLAGSVSSNAVFGSAPEMR